MGNLSSGCGCSNNCMSTNTNNHNDCCSIIWILLLLSVFCGNGTGSFLGGNGCDDGCGSNSCMWIILLLLFCGNGFGGGCGSTTNTCGCGCAAPWNNGCSDNCGC